MFGSDKYLPRLADPVLDNLMAELPAVMLLGPRGCGKTTTALRRAKAVLRLDQPDQAAVFRAAPDTVLAAATKPVLLDEWQNAPEALGAIKRAVDAGAAPESFVITGSVRSRHLTAGWPGTGRIVPLNMDGLTVSEATRATGSAMVMDQFFSPENPPTGQHQTAPDLIGYIDLAMRGGFPDVLKLSASARSAWFQGYVEDLVHRDVADLAEVRSPAAMNRLVRAIALNTAGQPSLATLAEAAGISHRTAVVYLDLLQELRVIERLEQWGANHLKRLTRTPKYYVADPGLAAFLAGDSPDSLLQSGTRLGQLIDTFVMAQLRPLAKLALPRITMLHLRSEAGRREVDLVLEAAAGQIVGIEIKAGATVEARSARHLAWLRDHTGQAFVRGFVLHTGTATYPLGDRLWAMPIAQLWQHRSG